MTQGTIYPDGRVQYYGYEKMESRVLDVRNGFITIHHAGGRYWDNGGEHYVAAHVEVMELAYLRRGNEPGTWNFRLGQKRIADFHPTPKEAVRLAMNRLENHGEKMGESLDQQ